jgi:spore maturation protein CgeB
LALSSKTKAPEKERHVKILCTIVGKMDYDNSQHSLEYHTFWPACQKLGEAVLLTFGDDKLALNRKFTDLVQEFDPDVVFTVPFTDQWEDGTIESIKCPTVAWICDSYRRDYLERELKRYSHIVGTDEKTGELAKRAGKPFLLSTWACNPDFHVPGPQKDLEIVWVGQKSKWRAPYTDALVEHFGSRAIVRGRNFPGGTVSWKEYINLLGRAKIGLSFSLDMSGVPQAKLRPFEVAAAKSMVLAEKPNYLDPYLREDKEYIGFEDVSSMIQQCEYFLLHAPAREKIANAGYRRTTKEHTFENRLREVFRWALA